MPRTRGQLASAHSTSGDVNVGAKEVKQDNCCQVLDCGETGNERAKSDKQPGAAEQKSGKEQMCEEILKTKKQRLSLTKAGSARCKNDNANGRIREESVAEKLDDVFSEKYGDGIRKKSGNDVPEKSKRRPSSESAQALVADCSKGKQPLRCSKRNESVSKQLSDGAPDTKKKRLSERTPAVQNKFPAIKKSKPIHNPKDDKQIDGIVSETEKKMAVEQSTILAVQCDSKNSYLSELLEAYSDKNNKAQQGNERKPISDSDSFSSASVHKPSSTLSQSPASKLCSIKDLQQFRRPSRPSLTSPSNSDSDSPQKSIFFSDSFDGGGSASEIAPAYGEAARSRLSRLKSMHKDADDVVEGEVYLESNLIAKSQSSLVEKVKRVSIEKTRSDLAMSTDSERLASLKCKSDFFGGRKTGSSSRSTSNAQSQSEVSLALKNAKLNEDKRYDSAEKLSKLSAGKKTKNKPESETPSEFSQKSKPRKASSSSNSAFCSKDDAGKGMADRKKIGKEIAGKEVANKDNTGKEKVGKKKLDKAGIHKEESGTAKSSTAKSGTPKQTSNMAAVLNSLDKIRNERLKPVKRRTTAPATATEKKTKLLADGSENDRSRSGCYGDEPFADGSSSDDDWEEVKDLSDNDEDDDERKLKAQIPDKPVEFTLEVPDIMKRKRKGSVDEKDIFRRHLNRFRKETQENAHKVHLLCLLAYGRHINNNLCASTTLQAIALSIIPPEFCDQLPSQWSVTVLTRFAKWFAKTVYVEKEAKEISSASLDKHEGLQTGLAERKVASEQDHVLLFVVACRSLGLSTRLIYSLHPISHKAIDLRKTKSMKPPSAAAETTSKKQKNSSNNNNNSNKMDKTPKKSTVSKTSQSQNTKSSGAMKSPGSSTSCSKKSKIDESTQSQQNDVASNRNSESKSGVSMPVRVKNDRRRSCGSKVSYAEEEEEEDSEENNSKPKDVDMMIDYSDESGSTSKKGLNKFKRKSATENVHDDDDSVDEDFDVEQEFRSAIGSKKSKNKTRSKKKICDKEVSDSDTTASRMSDWWAEVYIEADTKWICVHSVRQEVNKPRDAGKFATQPISHVLAYDNGDHIKDVTMRYSLDWVTCLRRLRLNDDWWEKVLEPFQSLNVEKETFENLLMQETLRKKAMPTSVGEYKCHPLYALKRHLLKFEAIYPPSAVALGFVRGEPVYARECVHTLHAKEKWRHEGRLVRLDEEPYKIVRARPKWNMPKEINDNLKLALFGRWQTEQFIPYPAINGIVPKNEYGNVELFKPWMLPGGTIHISDTLPGFNKVAKKLGLDVAAAMVGWEFHGGFNHPVHEGWVVCEEDKDVLLAAWDEEQEMKREKDREKNADRIYTNWKTLVRGLLIKERLKKRFDLQERKVPESETIDEKEEKEEGEVAGDVQQCWPLNMQAKKKDEGGEKRSREKDTNLFPFEIGKTNQK